MIDSRNAGQPASYKDDNLVSDEWDGYSEIIEP